MAVCHCCLCAPRVLCLCTRLGTIWGTCQTPLADHWGPAKQAERRQSMITQPTYKSVTASKTWAAWASLLIPEAGAPDSHGQQCTCSCCSVSFGLFFNTRFGFWGLCCSRPFSGRSAPSSSCCCEPGPLQQGCTCLRGTTLCQSAFLNGCEHPPGLYVIIEIINVHVDANSPSLPARRCWRHAGVEGSHTGLTT